MRKLFITFLSLAFIFSSVACDGMAIGGRSQGESIDRKLGENCATFTLDGFDGKYSVKLDRQGLGEGEIYYRVTLSDGEVNVYYDRGMLWDQELLFHAKENESVVSKGGYLEGDSVTIVLEALTPATGTIEIDFEKPVEDRTEGHSWNEGSIYTVPGDTRQERVYTCTVCGACYSENI